MNKVKITVFKDDKPDELFNRLRTVLIEVGIMSKLLEEESESVVYELRREEPIC